MKVYYRIKCNVRGPINLGHSVAYFNKDYTRYLRGYISLFLPRIYNAFKRQLARGNKFDWDEYFAHVVSHEYIHSVLYKMKEVDASIAFDKIAGTIPNNPFDCRVGLPMADKETRQALKEDYPGMV